MAKHHTRRSVVRSIGCAGLTAALGPFVSRAARAQEKQIVLSSWGGSFQEALRKAYFEPFTKETGVKVVELTWGGQGLAKLKAQAEAGKVEVDALDGPPFWAAIGQKTGLLDKINLSGLQDAASHVPSAIGDYGYAYGSVSWGIAALKKSFPKKTPSSWRDVWDLKSFPGRRSFFGPLVARHIEYSLMADGVPASKVNPLDDAKVDRAFRKWEELKGKVPVWYQTTAQMEALLTNGEIDCGEFSSGRAGFLQSQGIPLSFEYNEAVMNLLTWVVAKNAPNKANLETFLRYSSQPARQAEFAKLTYHGPTNKRALDLIKDDQVLRNLTTHPDNLAKQVELDGGWWADNLGKLGPRWNAITSG